jgi:alpha-tubulin suppressor-like RCC1 family protein
MTLSRRLMASAASLVAALALVSGLDGGAATATAAHLSAGVAGTSEPGDGFTAITPVRVLDTRSGVGAPAAPLGATSSMYLNLSSQIPASATAVVLNLTGVTPTADTYVTAWAAGTAQPESSNLNLSAGEITSNLVTVAVSPAGIVELYNFAGSVDLVADLSGYYAPSSGSGITSISPDRVLDTRDGTGTNGAVGPVPANGTLVLDLSSVVPSSATAVVLTVTALDGPGFVTAWPDGQARPVVSNLNLSGDQITANLVTVGVTGQKIDLYTLGSTDLVADVDGYYSPQSGATFTPLNPQRVLDTRSGSTAVGAGTPDPVGPQRTVTMDLSTRVPATATSVLFNLTAADATADTFITAFPDGAPRPTASNLNPAPDTVLPDLVSVGLGAGNKVDLFNMNGSIDLIADLAGYFAPAGATCTSGCVYSWGYDGDGQLGDRITGTSSATPVSAFGLSNVTAIASGYALRSDGTVWAWGDNGEGELGDGATGLNCPYPVTGGKLPGSNCNSNVPVRVAGLSDVVSIASHSYGGTALTAQGTVWTLGGNPEFQSSGSDGVPNPPKQVTGLTDIAAIAGTNGASYALRSDGTVWAWSTGLNGTENIYGQLGNGTVCDGDPATPGCTTSPVQVSGLTGVTAIAGGQDDGYAVTADGSVWAWGMYAGSLASGQRQEHDSQVPVRIAGLSNVTALAAGFQDGYALTSTGAVWSWGYDYHGELGNGSKLLDQSWQVIPVQVSGLTDVTQVAAGGLNAFALTSTGTVWDWGNNTDGQLGNGTIGQACTDPPTGSCLSTVPVEVVGISGAIGISGGRALLPGAGAAADSAARQPSQG